MSEGTIEAQESEAWEGTEGEGAGEALESEAYPSEAGWAESSGDDARRRRHRDIMRARRQERVSRPSARPPAPPMAAIAAPGASQAARAASQAVRAVSDDVRALDLDTRAALRSLRRELDKAKQHGNEAAYAATAATILNQGLDTFEGHLEDHPLVRALIRAAPLGLLYSYGPKVGAGKFVFNPITIGVVGMGSILITEKLISGSYQDTTDVVLSGPSTISRAAGLTRLRATALDRNGHEIAKAAYVWRTDNPAVASVDPNGYVKAKSKGSALITATSGGVTRGHRVKITK